MSDSLHFRKRLFGPLPPNRAHPLAVDLTRPFRPQDASPPPVDCQPNEKIS
jgi:hypothetical protein